MAFAVAALHATGPSVIEESDSVVISYPNFFDTMGRLLG
jgi:5-enolpyruvylshikimate-3-phosphate synthase